ncbi:MAG: ATP-dependent metallopeptidase FtsH/Yme1/Tma family protein, partial [Candidatus Humimicrobiaceae bacterium]
MKNNFNKKGFGGRRFKNIALLILLIVIMFLIFRNPLFLSPEVKEFSMDEFVSTIESGRVSSVVPLTIKAEDGKIEGELADGTIFEVAFLSDYDITQFLLENDIAFKVDNQQQ